MQTADQQPTPHEEIGQPLGFRTALENLLKQPERIVLEIHQGRWKAPLGIMLAMAALCLPAYGLTLGLFSGGVQLWAAPLKVLLGVLFSAAICFPSLFIFACLSGSSAGVRETAAILASGVALLALLLLGFAPVSWIFAQSTASIGFMGGLSLAILGLAFRYGVGFILRAFTLLNSQHRRHLMVWSSIFALVLLQMTATLRPILGTSDRLLPEEKKFFLTHWVESMEDSLTPDSARRGHTGRQRTPADVR